MEQLNIITSVLLMAIMLYEVYLSQLVSMGGYYTVINRSKLGYKLISEQKKQGVV